jgi:hypothetical protein
VEDAVGFICHAASLEQFKATKESQQKMEDLALACQVKATLIEQFSDIAVTCDYGNVLIYAKSGERQASRLKKKAKQLKREMEKINNLEIRSGAAIPSSAV